MLLKKSTARNRVFSFVGVSLTSLSVTISKDGGAFAAPAGTLSNITGNYYKLALTSADTDTVGDLAYKFSDTVIGVTAPNGEDVDYVGAPDVILADNVTHGGTAAMLRLGSSTSIPALYVSNSGGDAAEFESTSGGYGASFYGDVGGAIVYTTGSFGTGLFVRGAGGAPGFECRNVGGDYGSSPAFIISSPHGPAALLESSSGHSTVLSAGSPISIDITDAANGTPILIATATAHGLIVGDQVTITGVTGNTAANGTFRIAAINDATSFYLANTSGNGSYISGGHLRSGRCGLVATTEVDGEGCGIFSMGISSWGIEQAALKLEGGTTTSAIQVTTINADGILITAAGSGKHDIKLAGSSDILGNLTGTINGLTAAGLATLFTVNSTKVYADAVTGSPVKEIASNAGGGGGGGTVNANIVSVNGTTFAGANIPSKLADAVTHGGSTAILNLSRLVMVSVTSNQPAIKAVGNGTAPSVQFGDSTNGAEAFKLLAGIGNTNAAGLYIARAGSAHDVSLAGDGQLWDMPDNKEVETTPTVPITALDAAGVRSAIGIGAANLDTQLATIGTDVSTTYIHSGNGLSFADNMEIYRRTYVKG